MVFEKILCFLYIIEFFETWKKVPFWMTLYAEGTRFTKAKHEAAEEIAKDKGYKPLNHHLQPRPTGFVTIIKKLRENKVKK